MSGDRQTEDQAGRKALPIVRGLLILALLLVAAAAIRWAMLYRAYSRAVSLYEQEEYAQAHDLLQGVIASPLSAFRIRSRARRALGMCVAEMASDLALREPSLAGYTRALDLLEQARELVGPSQEIERRIREYRE